MTKTYRRSPKPIPKHIERSLLEGTIDDWRAGSEEPIEPARPFRGQTVIESLVRERSAITGQTPLEYLLEVMRDSRNSQYTRLEAAKAAAPYVHARLARVEQKLADGTNAQIVFLGGVLANPGPVIEVQKLDS